MTPGLETSFGRIVNELALDPQIESGATAHISAVNPINDLLMVDVIQTL